MRHYFSGNLLSGAAAAAAAAASENPHRCTPNHPPYSQMVAVSLQVLSDEGGSTEAAISARIQSSFTDLPWGHDRLLPYYLGRLVAAGELTSPSPGRYQLPLRPPPSLSSAPSSFTLPRRRGRPPLPRPNPSSSPVFSPPPRGRGRRPMRRHRGRPPIAHLAEGALRRRGRPPLRRDGAVGGTPARKLKFGFRSSGSTKRGYDDFVPGNEEGRHCLEADGSGQSEIWSFRGELEDAEEGPPFLAPGQSEQGEERLSPGKGPTLLVLEQSEHGCRQFSLEKESPFLAPEESVEHGEGQSSPGELWPSATLEVSAEHGNGQSAGEAPPAMAAEQSLLGEEQAFVTPEQSEHGKGQASPGQGLPLAAPEESERSQGLSSLGDGLEAALVMPPLPDGEEIDESGVSTRQRKPRAKNRRLWFEG